MSDTEKKYSLIIDRIGILGYYLSQVVVDKEKVILCSSRFFQKKNLQNKNYKHLLYKKRLPAVSNLPFSKIFLVVNTEKEIFDLAPALLKKAQRDGSRVFVFLYYKNYSAYLRNLLTQPNLESSLILIGDIVSRDQELNNQEILYGAHGISQMLLSFKTQKRIELNGMGTMIFKPIYFETILKEILTLVSQPSSPRIVFLFSKTSLTELSLARYIKQIYPQIKIDFTKMNIPKEPFFRLPDDGMYLPENYEFKKEFKEVISEDFKEIENEIPITEKSDKKKEKNNKQNDSLFSFKNFFLHGTIVIIGVLVLPFLATLFIGFLGMNNLQASRKALEKGDLPQSKSAVYSSSYFFKTASELSTLVAIEASVLGLEQEVRPLLRTIESGKELSYVMGGLVNASEILISLSQNKSKNPKEDFLRALQYVKSANKELQKLDVSVEDTYIDRKSVESIRIVRGPLGIISELSENLPEVFGFNHEKIYLVLLQNNMELRPGGGFIGSFGLVKIQNAQIKDFKIHNVYDADGQLKGHVEPPFAIRRYLPSIHWYLRDSNFNVDFQKNAEDALFFLDKEIQIDADGVIAINVSFIPNLLSVIGPVSIPDYGKTLTQENAYQEIQKEVEKNSFAGSTQKSDFLSAVFQAIIQKITSEKTRYFTASPNLLFDALQKKQVLIYMEDPSLKRFFIANNLSSSLWDDRNEEDNNINDYLAMSEANLGVNKVNYYVERRIEQEITIENNGIINEKLLVQFKNKSQKDDYKNYLRFILPFATNIRQITTDDTVNIIKPAITDPTIFEGSRFKSSEGLEVEEYTQANKAVFGFLTPVSGSSTKKITLEYSLSKPVIFSKQSVLYDLFFMKQPGVESIAYSFKLNFPKELKVFKVEPKGFITTENNKNNSITLLGDITRDTHIRVELTHK